jgi:hypothetical protein
MYNSEESCARMIESILCYDCKGYTDAIAVREYERNAYRDYLADYEKELGEIKVLLLIQNRIDAIDHIETNVYTDSDGLSYNSIKYKAGFFEI